MTARELPVAPVEDASGLRLAPQSGNDIIDAAQAGASSYREHGHDRYHDRNHEGTRHEEG
jgi:hypothetical protein